MAAASGLIPAQAVTGVTRKERALATWAVPVRTPVVTGPLVAVAQSASGRAMGPYQPSWSQPVAAAPQYGRVPRDMAAVAESAAVSGAQSAATSTKIPERDRRS